ncbi:lantibiotic dehydratase [Pedobacter metabolipauper]|uniref:Thiopeptide-type bacteriocin biosynthesis protein n=1 Tax=Pedobacter metabolipauper TaxID=425513 RepID=A0A4R6SS14_9SPHI|nr:lantibiotic dehydratase [Pedobacter metabolipauper]TDQ06477.1 thiopeptide-type bacteriocin biosynthesis protein [Pedobacter metabolipauper]
MKLKNLDIALCRTPAYGIESTLEEEWESLKEKIKESSIPFYELIASKCAADLVHLDDKVQFTIWKYFNRSKYRSTPFGSFAAFTVLPVSQGDHKVPLQISNAMISHEFADWSNKEHYIADVKKTIRSSIFFFANSSLYKVGNEIRYIRIKDKTFELATLNCFPELDALLKLCSKPVMIDDIYEQMLSKFNLSKKESYKFIGQLIKVQLLITDRFPNITGNDYFNRLNYPLVSSSSNYILSERKHLAGSIEQQKIRIIPEVISFLSNHLPVSTNSDLTNFGKAFLNKFEGKEIPLSIAMDPEVGVGYGNLEQGYYSDLLIETINATKSIPVDSTSISYTELHRFVLDKLIQGKNFQLDEFKGAPTSSPVKLPNTFSVMFSLYQDKPVITNIGGCTANSLLGRFTMSSTELEDHCKEIAALEEQANPDVMFFDIAYQAEKHIDNVNRRKSLYKKELAILTWSCMEEPLSLNDIMVSVQGQQIILRSKKYGKRMVPRLPSAYNYTRSDLSVYRFLCDLQHQDIRSDLNFDLKHYFPDLQHYPRVCYKELILCPSMWLVPKKIYEDQKGVTITERIDQLSTWLNMQKIDFLFKAGNTDQTLCFDPNKLTDLKFFLTYCSQQDGQPIYISEALINKHDCIKDEGNNNYVPQYIVNYSHHDMIYEALNPVYSSLQSSKKLPDILLPGEEWLYFEIHVHPSKSNSLLTNQIAEFLRESRKSIKKWFFIRYYDDNGNPLIRLRLHLKDPIYGFQIIIKLKPLIRPEIYNGTVGDFKIRTYYREMARYEASHIQQVEYFFWKDSKYASLLISNTTNTEELYTATLYMIQLFLDAAFDSLNEQIAFSKNMAENFAVEFHMNPKSFKTINQAFNEFKKTSDQKIHSQIYTAAGKLVRSFSKLIKTYDTAKRPQIISDLIHMHINRIFALEQRVHEAIIYHYLVKVLLSRRGNLTNQEVPVS